MIAKKAFFLFFTIHISVFVFLTYFFIPHYILYNFNDIIILYKTSPLINK